MDRIYESYNNTLNELTKLDGQIKKEKLITMINNYLKGKKVKFSTTTSMGTYIFIIHKTNSRIKIDNNAWVDVAGKSLLNKSDKFITDLIDKVLND